MNFVFTNALKYRHEYVFLDLNPDKYKNNMATVSETNHRLAALSLFRELYNNNKNVYAILCTFVEYVVVKSNKTQFTATDIAVLLKKEFNFMIPEAVLDFVCKKHCTNITTVRKGIYECEINTELKEVFEKTKGEITTLTDDAREIVEKIYSFYISQHPKSDKTEEDIKSGISSSLYNFCLDNSYTNGYTDIISAFIVFNEHNPDIIEKISEIKEGVILYTGMRYTDTNSTSGQWTNNITFYLDTELLFSAFGYNGEIEKKMFDEFFELVEEVNKSSFTKNKKIIRLRYFEETKIEIDKFFEVAVEIINGRNTTYPGNSAMPKITDGCFYKSDVKDKYVRFFDYINNTLQIEEDSIAYYQEQFNQYNIDEGGLAEYFHEKYESLPIDNIQKALTLLNYINIKRRGVNTVAFDGSKYLLVTGKNFVMNMVSDEKIRKLAPTYWATTIQFATNRMWFRLNKGFGKGIAPIAFNVVASAQVLLATQMKNKVTKSFAKFKEDVKEGKLTEDQIKIQYAGYRQDTIDADSVNSSNVQDILSDIISDDYYEKHLREETLLRQKVEELTNQVAIKDIELLQAEKKISELEKSSQEQYTQQRRQINRLLQKDIDDLKSKKTKIESKIKIIEHKVARRAKTFKIVSYVLAFIFTLSVIFITYKFGWDNIGSIITIALFILSGINLILIRERKEPKQNWINKQVHKYEKRLKNIEGISDDSLLKVDKEIKLLENEINQ